MIKTYSVQELATDYVCFLRGGLDREEIDWDRVYTVFDDRGLTIERTPAQVRDKKIETINRSSFKLCEGIYLSPTQKDKYNQFGFLLLDNERVLPFGDGAECEIGRSYQGMTPYMIPPNYEYFALNTRLFEGAMKNLQEEITFWGLKKLSEIYNNSIILLKAEEDFFVVRLELNLQGNVFSFDFKNIFHHKNINALIEERGFDKINIYKIGE